MPVIGKIAKGQSCRDCWNCLTRTFRGIEPIRDWYAEKGLRLPDHVLERWEDTAGKGILRLFWCKVETPIKPLSNPPWWGKKSALKEGCLSRL